MTVNRLRFGTIKQASKPTVSFTWPLDSSHTPTDLTGFTITGTMSQVDSQTATTSISGTFTVVDGATRACTWAMTSLDTGTDGRFRVTLSATDGVDTILTLFGDLDIEDNPSVDAVQNDPLVGVSADDASWLTAQNAAVAAVANDNTVNVQDGVLTDAGFAMTWNDTDKTVNIPLNGNVTLQTGQEVLIYTRNQSGVTINNGDIVRLSGSTGDRVTISLAQADTLDNARQVGMATETIANNSFGFVAVIALVRSQDTSAWNEGDVLYLSPDTAGLKITALPVYPEILVEVGLVIRKHPTDGIVFVNAYETPSGAYVKAAAASLTPTQLADAAAANGSLYYSTDANKLVFKDLGGVVNNLY